VHRRHVSRSVGAALDAEWSVDEPADLLAANPNGVRSPYAVLQARLADLPPAPSRRRLRPPWCGTCDRQTRLEDTEHGPRRCHRCHPLTRPNDAAPAA
jgi:hypothetical protein